MILHEIDKHSQKHLFKEMYKDYIKELSQYSKQLKRRPVTPKEIDGILLNPLLFRWWITDQNKNPIGFCLVGYGRNTHPDTRWFIAEFYIKPSERRKGYARKAITELLSFCPGTYSYFVLKQNIKAKMFWNKMREEHNCIDIKNDCKYITPPCDCIFEAFKTSTIEEI